MTGGKPIVERVWRSDLLGSTEHFRLLEMEDGHRLSGTVTIAGESGQEGITYEVDTQADWLTRRAQIQIPEMAIEFNVGADGSGKWWIDGQVRSDLEGCTDIDLGWTPATNTLPIRRAAAKFGRPTEIKAAWLRWPELTFVAATQTYTQLDETTWRYEHAGFNAVLEVDPRGVVISYGDPPIWYSSSFHSPDEES